MKRPPCRRRRRRRQRSSDDDDDNIIIVPGRTRRLCIGTHMVIGRGYSNTRATAFQIINTLLLIFFVLFFFVDASAIIKNGFVTVPRKTIARFDNVIMSGSCVGNM